MPKIPGSYSRTLLHKNDAFEIVSMRWEPRSTTPIHDHGNSHCWVVMLDGEFDVESFERDDDGGEIATIRKTDSAHVKRGDVDYRLGWRELHRVTNNGTVAAYTVQLYFSPIHDYATIDEHTGIVRKAFAQYDALYDLDITQLR